MSAPIGNQNAARAKNWRAALERAIERLGDPTINPDVPIERTPFMKGIDQLADAAVLSGINLGKIGVTSRSDLADRLDGKPAQQVQLSGDNEADPIRHRIEQVIVDANDPSR